MSRWSPAEKDAVATAARELIRTSVIPPDVEPFRACLWFAVAGADYFSQALGVRTVVQAGSASWPMINPEDDDGVRATHFSYRFSMQDAILRLYLGQLPELHCWFAIPDTQEIVDLSAGEQKDMAEFSGFTWTAPTPPPYVWADATTIHPDVRYIADPDAGFLVRHNAPRLVHVPWRNPVPHNPASKPRKNTARDVVRPSSRAAKAGGGPNVKGKLKHSLFPPKKTDK